MTIALRLHTIALCSSIVLLAACSSKADRIDSGLAKSAEYVRQADWDKASVEMRNVLQIDPKNAQAYYLAGQIAEAKSEVQRAYGSYSKAVELKADHLDAKAGLARLFMLADRLPESEKSIAEVLATDPKHQGALTARAALTAKRGDTDGAIAQTRSLIAEQKALTPDAYALLAGLYTSQGKASEALEAIEAGLKAQPKQIGLLQIGAQVAAASPNAAEQTRATHYYRLATEQSPRNTELWTAWAVHHTRLKELDKAEAVLRAAIKSQPDDSTRQLTLMEFLSARRGVEVAEKEYLAQIAARPKDSALRFGLANLYRANRRPDDARKVLQDIAASSKDAPAALSARNQLAAEALSHGKTQEAKTLNGEVLAASPRDAAALLMRGRMLLADGDARSAVIDLRAAVKDQPGVPEVVGLLAQAHRLAGEPQLAREVLVDAVKLKPSQPDLRLLLAADMADARDYAAASAEADAAIKAAPKNMRGYDMKAQIALAQKKPAAAEAVYVAYKQNSPQDASGALKLGQLYGDQKKYDAALREYEAAAKLAPGAEAPMLSVVGLLIAQRRFDEAHKRVDAYAPADNTGALQQRLHGEVALAQGDLVRADQAYARMIEIAPNSPAAYQGLAQVRARQGRMVDALGVLEKGERANPGDATLAALRAEWTVRAGRTDEAIALYEALHKRSPGDPATANNLAYLLSETRGADTATLTRALGLVQGLRDSPNPGHLDTLGWTHYKLGQYGDAVSVLERAVQRDPEAALYQLHLGLALHKKGDTARAQEHLKRAVNSKAPLPGLEEARTLLAMK